MWLLYIHFLLIELPENMLYCYIYCYREKTYIGMEDFGYISQPSDDPQMLCYTACRPLLHLRWYHENTLANRMWLDLSYDLYHFNHTEPFKRSNTFLKWLYLESVGVQVSFVLSQSLIHASHLGQRVPESCVLRLQFVEQQRELCVTALSLKGHTHNMRTQNFNLAKR